MKVKKYLQPNFIISICLIAACIAGFLPLFLNVFFCLIGLFGAFYSIINANIKEEQVDCIIEAEAKLFAKAGHGNVYTEAFLTQLRKKGSCNNAPEILSKALEIDPDDKDAMAALSLIYALNLSFQRVLGDSNKESFKRTVKFGKELSIRGAKLYPKEHLFYDSLGIFYDIEGDHENARNQFVYSGKLRKDPYWRLFLSTSWLMTGDSKNAVGEIEKAIQEGAIGWLVDFYYGRALSAMGEFERAEPYLLSAYRTRGYRYEILTTLEKNYRFQLKFFSASKFGLLSGIVLLINGRVSGLKLLVGSIFAIEISISSKLSKIMWSFFKNHPKLQKIFSIVSSPEEPEVEMSNTLIEEGYYRAAEMHLRKACMIRPDKGHCYASLAVSLFKQGRIEEAIQAADHSILLNPEIEAFKHNRRTFELGEYDKGKLISIDEF